MGECGSISHMHVEYADDEGDYCIDHGFQVVAAHPGAEYVMHQTSEPWMLGGIPGCEWPKGVSLTDGLTDGQAMCLTGGMTTNPETLIVRPALPAWRDALACVIDAFAGVDLRGADAIDAAAVALGALLSHDSPSAFLVAQALARSERVEVAR